MSRQLRALEELGLVAREPDPADGRALLVHLTDEGRARFRSVRDARRDAVRPQAGRLGPARGRRTGAAAAPAERRPRMTSRLSGGRGAGGSGARRPGRPGASQLHVDHRRVVVRLAAPQVRRAPCPPSPAPGPGRSAPCGPSLRSSAEAGRPVALAGTSPPSGSPRRSARPAPAPPRAECRPSPRAPPPTGRRPP